MQGEEKGGIITGRLMILNDVSRNSGGSGKKN